MKHTRVSTREQKAVPIIIPCRSGNNNSRISSVPCIHTVLNDSQNRPFSDKELLESSQHNSHFGKEQMPSPSADSSPKKVLKETIYYSK